MPKYIELGKITRTIFHQLHAQGCHISYSSGSGKSEPGFLSGCQVLITTHVSTHKAPGIRELRRLCKQASHSPKDTGEGRGELVVTLHARGAPDKAFSAHTSILCFTATVKGRCRGSILQMRKQFLRDAVARLRSHSWYWLYKSQCSTSTPKRPPSQSPPPWGLGVPRACYFSDSSRS